MPEVVYTKSGDNWDDVFPIIKQQKMTDNAELSVINAILYTIAVNSFKGLSTTALKNRLKKQAHEDLQKALSDTERSDSERQQLYAEYGRSMYYIEEVFRNLGGAYRAR